MKGARRILMILCLSLAPLGTATSQEGGQICVMSFEDRNGNGRFDENEPPVTQGIAVNAQSALGITVATKLLEASSYVAPGLLCLDDLPRGEYQLHLTSALYQATTDSAYSALVAPGMAPARLDFGVVALPLAAVAPQAASDQLSAQQMQGLRGMGIGLIASILISLLMLLIGGLIFILLFHRRLNSMRAQRQKPHRPPAGATSQELELELEMTQMRTAHNPPQSGGRRGTAMLFADDDTGKNPAT